MFKLDEKPAKIGTVKGRTYYEHPEYGDECELIIKVPGGWELSGFWELPHPDECPECGGGDIQHRQTGYDCLDCGRNT